MCTIYSHALWYGRKTNIVIVCDIIVIVCTRCRRGVRDGRGGAARPAATPTPAPPRPRARRRGPCDARRRTRPRHRRVPPTAATATCPAGGEGSRAAGAAREQGEGGVGGRLRALLAERAAELRGRPESKVRGEWGDGYAPCWRRGQPSCGGGQRAR